MWKSLVKKNKNIFPKNIFHVSSQVNCFFFCWQVNFFFTPFDTRKIKFHVWNREKKIILMWNLFYFHMQKKISLVKMFSVGSTHEKIVHLWEKKKIFTHGKNIFVSRVKKCLVVKMRITEWNTFFFFTPLTQHIFSLDTWKYFFHVWNRVNFFFHSGKLIFRA